MRWREFDKKARVASHSHLGVIELMPVADDGAYAFKYVNGHPHNTQVGLPTVMAFGVLAEVDTGYPVLLSELTLTTRCARPPPRRWPRRRWRGPIRAASR